MVQHYENTSSVDYSLKEGETLVLQLKNVSSHLIYFARTNELEPCDGFYVVACKVFKTRIYDFL